MVKKTVRLVIKRKLKRNEWVFSNPSGEVFLFRMEKGSKTIKTMKFLGHSSKRSQKLTLRDKIVPAR